MQKLTCNIIIGDYAFDYVNNVEIQSSWEDYTDKATIVIPKKLEFNGKEIIAGTNPLFKRGDKIEIWLGYDDDNKKEFEGYISDIKPQLPLIIECQDLMWKLKQSNYTISYKSVNLQKLLADLLIGDYSFPFVADDIELGAFRITNANILEVFEELKNSYGLITFAQDGTVYSGLPYKQELQQQVTYNLEHNVVDSSNLTYSRADDKRIKVVAISIFADNTKEEVEFGDADGEQRTFNFYNVPKSQLQETAERELERIKVDGYEGDFTAFGVPFVQHNDAVNITSNVTPEQNGTYLVKGVNVSFGMSGFRRVIKADKKI